VLLSLIYF
jgi:hypothetical protein